MAYFALMAHFLHILDLFMDLRTFSICDYIYVRMLNDYFLFLWTFFRL
jgi:hypothetical protein